VRGLAVTLAVTLCAPMATCALGRPPSADAQSFGAYGSASGQFIEPQGIAVDQQSGDLFVMDTNNHRVDRFNAEGGFRLAWGWAVADGHTKALQTCTTSCHAGLEGDAGGQFGFAEGLAVDNDPLSPSYHDVYVVDIGNHRVQKFSPGGRFLLAFGAEVNASAKARHEAGGQDICPVRPGDRCTAGVPGPGPGQFEFAVEGDYVAVGPDATVYVGDRNRVQEFYPQGAYRGQVRLTPQPQAPGLEAGGVSGLAVNESGELYVIRYGVSGVREYGPAGEPLQTLDDRGEAESNAEPTPALALDPSGEVFIDEFVEERLHRVLECDAAGHLLASFDVNIEDGLHGLAFGQRADRLYVVYTNNNIAPIAARVRIVAVPPAPAIFLGFGILAWCTGS
jgi:DNA-binding beta-propeller fold protein YncE